MIINCYYYAPHNHSLLAEHLCSDLSRIADLGTDAVSVCVQESQLTNWHQQRLRNVVDQIHAHGMQAYAVPNRWAGLVAGWLDGFGRFTLKNPDTLVRSEKGLPPKGETTSCINNPKVHEHIRRSLSDMFEHFDFDGLIWDEPSSGKCLCDHCRAMCDEPAAQWHHECFASFVDDMSRYAKTLREGMVVSLLVQPHQRGLLDALLHTANIDYLGSDGHVRSPSHRMHRMKGTIFEAYDEFGPLLSTAGKQRVFLPEAQRHRDEDLENYLANVNRAFELPMEQLMYYFSAHEMSVQNEGRFNDATWHAVQRAHERRLQP